MERKKALIASAIFASAVMTGAVAYAATSGLTNGRPDNVGQLQPTSAQPTTITVVVDPTTGTATATTQAVPQASPDASIQASLKAHESEDGDD